VVGGIFVVLGLLSIAWNLAVGDPWNNENFLDRIADAVTWWPW
jgi:hypothetical protein